MTIRPARWRERIGRRVPTAAIIAASLLLLAPLAALAAATIAGVTATSDRIELRFDRAVDGAAAFVLDDPRRIVIDVDGATAGRGGTPGGAVAAVRHGQYDRDTARVVLELSRPALVDGGRFALDARTLTLTVVPATETGFARAVNRARQRFTPLRNVLTGEPRPDRSSVRVPLGPPAARRKLPMPEISGARGGNRPLVVIDAGHGGHDPGAPAVDGSTREKDVTLAIAKAIRDELAKSGRVRVALTRADDRFLILGERREIARRLGADLFISIHADSAPNAQAHGATVYTLSEVASDRVAARLAARENRADILNGVNLGGESDEVSSILLDLAQRETMNVSASFAALLQREMPPEVAFRSEFHKFAGFIVLKAPDVPSVLFETGYMSNADDVARLTSPEHRRRIATGVRRAVETHFARQLTAR